MANLYRHAEANIAKTWVYLTGFLLLVILVGWFISYVVQTQAILWFSVAVAILMSFFSYWYSDKIVLGMSRAKEVKKEDAPELYRIVENLSITAGLPLPRIYIIAEAQPNAFATGRSPKKGVVALTAGLLERLDRRELEGVLAHELGHIGNRDILLSTIVVVLVGAVVMLADFFFRIAFWRNMGQGGRGGEQARLIMVLFALALAVLAPIFATLLKLAISRKREFLADASGALLTRYPEGLASALEKISQASEPMRTASDATAHLYIASPFKGRERTSWLHKLFMTHPPVEERVRALRGMKT
jgi:heat shock protein HtpX